MTFQWTPGIKVLTVNVISLAMVSGGGIEVNQFAQIHLLLGTNTR